MPSMRCIFSLYLAIAMFGGMPAWAGCSKEFTIVYFNSEPYHFDTPDGTVKGLDADILRDILSLAGCTSHFTRMPLKRAFSALEAGLVDIAMGASLTKEREAYARFSIPYRRELMVMFMRTDDLHAVPIRHLADVPDLKLYVGAHLGSWYGPEYAYLFAQNKAFRAQVVQSSDYENLYRALLAGRVDIVLDDIFNGHAILKHMGELAQADIHPVAVNDSVTHFMMSKNTVPESDVDQIDTAIRQYQASARYIETIKLYVPQDYLTRYPVLKASPALPAQSGDQMLFPDALGR